MADAFRACGLPAPDAATTAEAMLDADLSGSDAHGIFRLPGYVRTLKRGHINPQADIKVMYLAIVEKFKGKAITALFKHSQGNMWMIFDGGWIRQNGGQPVYQQAETLTVNGNSLTQTRSVNIGGTVAGFTVNSDTQLTVTVPTGAATGKITITTNGGVAVSTTEFTVTK